MLKPYFGENASGRGNVNSVNNVKSLLSKELPTEEMLIMLIMLSKKFGALGDRTWDSWG